MKSWLTHRKGAFVVAYIVGAVAAIIAAGLILGWW